MPVSPTFPGVYIEEIPSGVRTIVGVATSITAFVGRASRGPVGEGINISSFDEFERRFGGLAAGYPMTYAVRDFYRNGGSEAIIVRLYKASAPGGPAPAAGDGAALPAEVVAAAQAVADAALGAGNLPALQTIDQHASVTGPRDAYQQAADKASQSEFALAVARLEQSQAQAELNLAQAQLDAALEALNKAIIAGSDPAAAQTAAQNAKAKVDQAKTKLKTKSDTVQAAETQLNNDRQDMAKKAAIKGAADAVAGEVVKKAGESGVTVDEVKDHLRGTFLDGADKIKPDALHQIGVGSGSDTPPPGKSKAVLVLDGGKLNLEAASEGDWANGLMASVNSEGITDEVAGRYSLPKTELFNLIITDTKIGVQETLRNLTVNATSPRSVAQVLKNQSNLVRVSGTPTGRPADNSTATVASENRAAASDFLPGESDYDAAFKALDKVDLFNLLCIPPDGWERELPSNLLTRASQYCYDRRAMFIIDAPLAWGQNRDAAAQTAFDGFRAGVPGISGEMARNAALYFPRVRAVDPQFGDQIGIFPISGMVAGVMARTDTNQGVWKAPAGIDAALNGIVGLQVNLNDAENGKLNPLGINCLRTFPVFGSVVWGARTLRGADQLADEYKYIPIRRLALFIEESLYRGLKWVVFEPNDEPLWAQIRLNVGAFMHDLFRKGAFQGTTPRDAYLVKCDAETTTQSDRNQGIVNIIVGFAPLKPAEFVIIKLQQMAGQIEV